MHGPPLVGWLLVLLCATAGGYCLAQARTGPAAHRVAARGEALMGLGMAAMALPVSAVVPPWWSPWVFTAVFGAVGLWALARRHGHHTVGALAMVYMALAMAAGQAGGGQSADLTHTQHAAPGGAPLLTGLLLAYYTVFVLAAGVRLVPAAAVAADGPVPAAAPGRPAMVRACQVAMGMAMFAMLLTV
ncbi:DUF5134 domain-containing protein [Streptomyces sp. NPDC017993]|uniref:DUF5134 domain-containing protein n=1 Tax=Streptomyces sp. NPDC017993 TaxID=3365027 RepID=UPI0037921201